MKNLGIVVAMDEEREAVSNIMDNVERVKISDISFYIGNIKKRKCILVKSGVGKVNAARATQKLIDKFEVDQIINVGAAGAINCLMNIGDVLIGRCVVQHDFDITAFGHSKGYITGVGNQIETDKAMTDKLEKALNNVSEKTYNIKLGIVASGDIFCTDIAMKDKISAKFGADVVDMECAAIAQVCYLEKIAFTVIRCISDTPNGENARTFDENLKLASKRCANILKLLV